MYVYEFFLSSSKEKAIASYDALFDPFDMHIWIFIIALMLLEISFLLTVEYMWHSATGGHSSSSYVFEGT
jgi:hypothetical protein